MSNEICILLRIDPTAQNLFLDLSTDFSIFHPDFSFVSTAVVVKDYSGNPHKRCNMSFYPCFFLISVALFGAVTCIDNNSRVLVHATECTAHGETTQRCRFNSRGLQLQTSSTIEFVAHNGNTVKCGKKNVVGDNVWYGECEGDARDANFVQRTDDNGDALVFGSIHIGTDICHISPNADGIDEISCTPISDFPEEEESVLAPPHDEDDYLNRDRTRSLEFLNDPTAIMSDNMHRDLQDNSTAVIDVMVVWTKQAECKVSGLLDMSSCTLTTVTENNMLGLIDLAVTETNTALQLSGIYSTLRLVHAYRDLTYVEPTSNVYPVALEELRNLTDGKLDSVHKKRTLYGADLVQLFMSTSLPSTENESILSFYLTPNNPIHQRCI